MNSDEFISILNIFPVFCRQRDRSQKIHEQLFQDRYIFSFVFTGAPPYYIRKVCDMVKIALTSVNICITIMVLDKIGNIMEVYNLGW